MNPTIVDAGDLLVVMDRIEMEGHHLRDFGHTVSPFEQPEEKLRHRKEKIASEAIQEAEMCAPPQHQKEVENITLFACYLCPVVIVTI